MCSLSFSSPDRRLAEPAVVGTIGNNLRSVCEVKLKGLRLNPYVISDLRLILICPMNRLSKYFILKTDSQTIVRFMHVKSFDQESNAKFC